MGLHQQCVIEFFPLPQLPLRFFAFGAVLKELDIADQLSRVVQDGKDGGFDHVLPAVLSPVDEFHLGRPAAADLVVFSAMQRFIRRPGTEKTRFFPPNLRQRVAGEIFRRPVHIGNVKLRIGADDAVRRLLHNAGQFLQQGIAVRAAVSAVIAALSQLQCSPAASPSLQANNTSVPSEL